MITQCILTLKQMKMKSTVRFNIKVFKQMGLETKRQGINVKKQPKQG